MQLWSTYSFVCLTDRSGKIVTRYLQVQLTLLRSTTPLPHPPTSLPPSPPVLTLSWPCLSHPLLNPHLTFPQPSPSCPTPPSPVPHPTPFCAAPTHFFHYLSAPIIFQTSFHLPPSSLNPSSPSQPLSVPSELCIYIHLFIILDSLARLWKTCVIYFHFQNSSILLFTVAQFYCNSASCSLTFHFSHFLLHSTLPLLFDFVFKRLCSCLLCLTRHQRVKGKTGEGGADVWQRSKL